MKKLTKKEASQIKTLPDGRASYAYGVLLAMNVGDVILLEPADWTRKSQSPKTYCLQLGRSVGRKWKCNRVLEGTGWVIERVG